MSFNINSTSKSEEKKQGSDIETTHIHSLDDADIDDDLESLLITSDNIKKKYRYASLIELPSNHPELARNFPNSKKIWIVVLYTLCSMVSQASSSVLAPSSKYYMEHQHVSKTVAMLPTSSYMFGVAMGPMFAAPLSERYGRKMPVLIPCLLGSIIMLLSSFMVSNFAIFIIFRFLTGVFCSTPVISSGGSLKDLFNDGRRPDALLCFAVFVGGSPSLGPIIGSLILNSTHNPKYILIIVGSISIVVSIISLIFVPETLYTVITAEKAKSLRIQRGDLNIVSKQDIHIMEEPLISTFKTNLFRPFLILWEPYALLLSFYGAYAYGQMYFHITGVPEFALENKYRAEKDGYYPISWIPAGFITGMILASIVIFSTSKRYRKHLKGGEKVRVEARLHAALFLSWLFPVSSFFLAFLTEKSDACAFIGLAMNGAAFFGSFQSLLNAIVDCYGDFSASATSATTFFRSLAAGIMPLISIPIVRRIGYKKLFLILGGVNVVICFIPVILYIWGPYLRQRSKLAVLKGKYRVQES